MNKEELEKKVKRHLSNCKQNFLIPCKYRFNKMKEFIKVKIKNLPPISSYYDLIIVVLLIITIVLFSIAISKVLNLKDSFKNQNNKIEEETNNIEDNDNYQNAEDIEKKQYHVSIKVNDDGYNLYAPMKDQSGYRYGPSIIMNDDGSFDAWFSSPGNNSSEWDWISYCHSDDGLSWSKEKIVLQPTGDSYDHYSICDPGVIFFNGYYYLGYTSTLVATNEGINNNVFVARSKNPDGPYEKWNGNGWGGKPKPIIYYNESNDAWGAGEISFVIANEKLYCYYTWICEHGNYTRVATAELSDDWPNTIEYQGIAYEKKYGQDSCDVVYLEEYNKFLTFAISERFSENSGVIIYESNNGLDFHKSDNIKSNISMFAHNMGISKRKDGHIKEDDNLYISYAYSNSANTKGKWATRFESIELIIYESKNFLELDKDGEPTYRGIYTKDGVSTYESGIGVKQKTINIDINDAANITTYVYNQLHKVSSIGENITYEYDENIINIKGNTIYPVSTGTCVVNVYYKDFYTTFTVNVRDEYTNSKEIIKFEPVQDTYILHLGDNHHIQIRGYVEFANGKWGESYNDYTVDHPEYPAMIDADEYLMKFMVKDFRTVLVDDSGMMYPFSVGETYVRVSIDDNYFIVKVIVED